MDPEPIAHGVTDPTLLAKVSAALISAQACVDDNVSYFSRPTAHQHFGRAEGWRKVGKSIRTRRLNGKGADSSSVWKAFYGVGPRIERAIVEWLETDGVDANITKAEFIEYAAVVPVAADANHPVAGRSRSSSPGQEASASASSASTAFAAAASTGGAGRTPIRVKRARSPSESSLQSAASRASDAPRASTGDSGGSRGKAPSSSGRRAAGPPKDRVAVDGHIFEYRSGSYAVLLTMYREWAQGRTKLSKASICTAAQSLCRDGTLMLPDFAAASSGDPRDQYCGWTSIEKPSGYAGDLVIKGFVRVIRPGGTAPVSRSGYIKGAGSMYELTPAGHTAGKIVEEYDVAYVPGTSWLREGKGTPASSGRGSSAGARGGSGGNTFGVPESAEDEDGYGEGFPPAPRARGRRGRAPRAAGTSGRGKNTLAPLPEVDEGDEEEEGEDVAGADGPINFISDDSDDDEGPLGGMRKGTLPPLAKRARRSLLGDLSEAGPSSSSSPGALTAFELSAVTTAVGSAAGDKPPSPPLVPRSRSSSASNGSRSGRGQGAPEPALAAVAGPEPEVVDLMSDSDEESDIEAAGRGAAASTVAAAVPLPEWAPWPAPVGGDAASQVAATAAGDAGVSIPVFGVVEADVPVGPSCSEPVFLFAGSASVTAEKAAEAHFHSAGSLAGGAGFVSRSSDGAGAGAATTCVPLLPGGADAAHVIFDADTESEGESDSEPRAQLDPDTETEDEEDYSAFHAAACLAPTLPELAPATRISDAALPSSSGPVHSLISFAAVAAPFTVTDAALDTASSAAGQFSTAASRASPSPIPDAIHAHDSDSLQLLSQSQHQSDATIAFCQPLPAGSVASAGLPPGALPQRTHSVMIIDDSEPARPPDSVTILEDEERDGDEAAAGSGPGTVVSAGPDIDYINAAMIEHERRMLGAAASAPSLDGDPSHSCWYRHLLAPHGRPGHGTGPRAGASSGGAAASAGADLSDGDCAPIPYFTCNFASSSPRPSAWLLSTSVTSAVIQQPVATASSSSTSPSSSGTPSPRILVRLIVDVHEKGISAHVTDWVRNVASNDSHWKGRFDCDYGHLPIGDYLWVAQVVEPEGAPRAAVTGDASADSEAACSADVPRGDDSDSVPVSPGTWCVLGYICERKRIDDLTNSMDNPDANRAGVSRMTRQLQELSACGLARKGLLVEGNPEDKKYQRGFAKQADTATLVATTMSQALSGGVAVIRSGDTEDTPRVLANLTKAIAIEAESRSDWRVAGRTLLRWWEHATSVTGVVGGRANAFVPPAWARPLS